jgi:hypothetical protein
MERTPPGISARRLSPARAIAYGTAVVGTLDAIDAMVVFGLRSGATPFRIFQGIASGWLGRASFNGGVPTALLGLATHFFIAFGIVAVYYVVSRKVPALTRRPVLYGILYGIAVYCVMNVVVIPLSAIGGRPSMPPLSMLANGLGIHMFGIGLPSALFAAWATPSGGDEGPIDRQPLAARRQVSDRGV